MDSIAHATPPTGGPPPTPGITGTDQNATSPDQGSNNQGLMRRSLLLGDLGGLREKLSKYGVNLNILETSEVLGNATGGLKRGADYDGLTQVAAQMDTQRAWGHHGGLFNASVLQIHGRDLSADDLQSLQTASGIEADRGLRLWELWYQQKYLEDDRLDLKVGQQSLDQEFMVSQNAGLFVNTMFGWAMVPSADLPGGGPAYPLSALGVRARWRPKDSLTLMGGVFNGSPDRTNGGDPQANDPHGLSFPLNGGTLAIVEAQSVYPALGSMVPASGAAPLPVVYKVGAYYDSESFDDLHYDTLGLSLANPDSNGIPASHRGNFGVYGVTDRTLWISPEDADRTLSFFGRGMTQPQSDRNPITLSLNAGLVLRDPLPKVNRDDDSFGIGMGFARVGSGAAGFYSDTVAQGGTTFPGPGRETFLEMTYQYQYTPWCQIQPDLQYVLNPGAGATDPTTGARVRNELVGGVRVNILF